jgi:alginate O-acetyltransferase complex protein AlgJ
LLLAFLAAAPPVSATAQEFRRRCLSVSGQVAPKPVVPGVEGWLFFREELEHVGGGRFWGPGAAAVSRAANPAHADPLPAIIDFHERLRERGISLLVVPVPPKCVIYPDRLFPAFAPDTGVELSELYREFFEELREAGVRTIDLAPAMLEERKRSRVYCKTDTHYAGAGLSLTAALIAEAIRKLDGDPSAAGPQLPVQRREVSILGDLAAMQGGQGESERVDVYKVLASVPSRSLVTARQSPVLLLGDSHTLVFSAGGDLHATGAGLGENLAAALGIEIDRIGVRGAGATASRIALYQRCRSNPAYLDSKRVIVWCFSAREFTGTGGWRIIPVAPR